MPRPPRLFCRTFNSHLFSRVRARGRMPIEVCGGAGLRARGTVHSVCSFLKSVFQLQRLAETTINSMLILTESSNHYQPYYSHLKTDGSKCAFWDLQQHFFFRKCVSILTRAPPQLCNLFGRECNSTEVTKKRNG